MRLQISLVLLLLFSFSALPSFAETAADSSSNEVDSEAEVDVEAEADDDIDEDEGPDLPKSGLLASSGSIAAGGATQVDLPWGSGALGEEGAPLSGGISRTSQSTFRISVNNRSKDKYRASLQFKQYGNSGRTLKTDSFSATLGPGESRSREVKARTSGSGAKLYLRSWKRFKKKKSK